MQGRQYPRSLRAARHEGRTATAAIIGTALLLAALAAPVRGWAQSDPAQRQVALGTALDRYRSLASQGGWQPTSTELRLVPGDSGSRVVALRNRLRLEGYSVRIAGDSLDWFDAEVEAAVRRFQELHGLEVDGIVGPATGAELDVPVESRIAQIEANLAPARLLPDSLGGRYLIVNSAAFVVDLIEDGRSLLRLPAIVGRPTWPTPVVSSEIAELIFRPLWTVPQSIATRELLPLIRRDPEYLARTTTRVFRNGVEVDPATIDWSTVQRGSFPYVFVQEPGPLNPLGGVKFVLRTGYNVFLHDTPARNLFSRRRRAFSHGCVRIADPDRLVAYLLPGWSADSIATAMAAGRENRVRVPTPIPVHLVYWTTWLEADGLAAFREDIYRRDRRRSAP